MRAILLVTLLALVAANAAAARDLQQVLNTGTLRVGVVLYAPWAVRTANGELDGFEVDVAKQLATDMGVKVEILAYDFGKLIPALESGEIDIIAAGLAITPGAGAACELQPAVRRERDLDRRAIAAHRVRVAARGSRQGHL